MRGHREIGERVLELLSAIDAERPNVDEELVADRLCSYAESLGLEAPAARFSPDVRALRVSRVYPKKDRGTWQAFSGRQTWLLDRPVDRTRRWTGRGWALSAPLSHDTHPGIERLVRLDSTALEVGLGQSKYVRGVRWATPTLDAVARVLLADGATAPKRAEALLPLAEAAAAGLFAYALGAGGDFVVLVRPRMHVDAEDRLHEWSGLPAGEWPSGKGLYFWHGVEMTESAGRDPDAVTPARVLGWANAERRRVAVERIGIEPFMHALGGTIVQEDDYGRLWRTQREIDGEPFVAVEVVNSTPEPDGSVKRYFLRVPPRTRTARHAVAWSFGLTTKAYAPAAQS